MASSSALSLLHQNPPRAPSTSVSQAVTPRKTYASAITGTPARSAPPVAPSGMATPSPPSTSTFSSGSRAVASGSRAVASASSAALPVPQRSPKRSTPAPKAHNVSSVAAPSIPPVAVAASGTPARATPINIPPLQSGSSLDLISSEAIVDVMMAHSLAPSAGEHVPLAPSAGEPLPLSVCSPSHAPTRYDHHSVTRFCWTCYQSRPSYAHLHGMWRVCQPRGRRTAL